MSGNGFTQHIPGTDLSFDMIFVEGGSFLMGDEHGDLPTSSRPVHEVKIPDFQLGKYPVNQALWKAVMGNNPSSFQGDQRPVEQVSWNDSQAFIQKLNQLTRQEPAKGYRLPSEAEWEFAARGGIYCKGYKYAGSNKLNEVSWYQDNSYRETKPVGLKFPNELGLYDMSGNIWEWCLDIWHKNYAWAPKDGSSWESGTFRGSYVVRGGSWFNDPINCRIGRRDKYFKDTRYINIGFRLVR